MHKLAITILTSCILVTASCTKSQPEPDYEYNVTVPNGFVIYDFDIEKSMAMTFGELEEELKAESEVDSEVGLVFIERKLELNKSITSSVVEDYIEMDFGPIEDAAIYEQYKQISPNTIYLKGTFSFDEDSIIKESVINELMRNLPDDSTTKELTNNIRNIILHGKPKGSIMYIEVNFKIPKFQISIFRIYRGREDEKNNQIVYQYLFSLLKEPYPGFPIP